MRLYRVEAPHFVAGVEVNEQNRIVRAARILNWALGYDRISFLFYCGKKGWKVKEVTNG